MQGLRFRYSAVNPTAPVAFCSFCAMHTVVELLFVSGNEARSKAAGAKVQTLVLDLEHSLSRHIDGGPLQRLNSSVGFFDTGDELFFCLELCENLRKATCGYFDIAALSQSRERPAYRFSLSEHKASRVSAEILLDLGGFAKGYAAEKVRKFLCEEEEVTDALVNFGNSTVVGIGHHPLGDCWKISPVGQEDKYFQLKDSALSVSGISSDGRRHIVDPITMTCPEKSSSLAVTGKSALICEILSTALYAAPEDLHKKILDNFPSYSVENI